MVNVTFKKPNTIKLSYAIPGEDPITMEVNNPASEMHLFGDADYADFISVMFLHIISVSPFYKNTPVGLQAMTSLNGLYDTINEMVINYLDSMDYEVAVSDADTLLNSSFL